MSDLWLPFVSEDIVEVGKPKLVRLAGFLIAYCDANNASFLHWQTPAMRGQEETCVTLSGCCPNSSMRWTRPTSRPLRSPSSWGLTPDRKTICQRGSPTRLCAEERDSRWWDLDFSLCLYPSHRWTQAPWNRCPGITDRTAQSSQWTLLV